MKYKGVEITEMTPDKWDGKSREMLCWHIPSRAENNGAFFKEVIVGYYKGSWYSSLGCEYAHCAEIPETAQQAEIKNLERSNSQLRCSLLHALSEVFRLKYEQAFDLEIVDTHEGYWKMKRRMHRKDMLLRKHLACRDAYKEAKRHVRELFENDTKV